MEDEVKRPAADLGAAGHRRLNAGKLTGQKPALKMKEVWSIRTRLELDGGARNLVLFDLAIDSKLRVCDLVRLKVADVEAGGHVTSRGVIIQKKTGRPVQFEITENTRRSITAPFGGRMPGKGAGICKCACLARANGLDFSLSTYTATCDLNFRWDRGAITAAVPGRAERSAASNAPMRSRPNR